MCLSIQWKNQWPFRKMTSWVERLPTLWVLRINKKTHHIITSWKSMGARRVLNLMWLDNIIFRAMASTQHPQHLRDKNTIIPGLSWINVAICGTPARCEVGISWAFCHLPRWASLPPPFVWRTIPAPSCGAGDRQSHRFGKPALDSWQHFEIAG